MNKFKKGDWVRAKHDLHGIDKDEVVKVSDVALPTAIGAWVMIEGKKNDTVDKSYKEDDLEPWMPRVGERVRFVRDNSDGGARYGAKDEVVTVTRVRLDGEVDVTSSYLGWNPAAYIRDLEPATTAATKPYINNAGAQCDTLSEEYGYDAKRDAAKPKLKIEAGKYYRTRGGHKVGPMKAFLPGGFIMAEGDGQVWLDDGKTKPGCKMDDGLTITSELEDAPAAPEKQEPKFKVGDVVTAHSRDDWANGKTGVVVTVYTDGTVAVKFKDARGAGWGEENDTWWVLVEKLTLVPTISIVARLDNGQPRPNTTPFVHASTEAAESEAKRLADKHPGCEFAVFTMGTKHKVEKVYAHEWQRLAASGRRIDAIKALRSVADIGLAPAKDAVENFLRAA